MNFDYADHAIKDMNRRAARAFNGLRTMKFDELNVLRSVSKVYDELVKRAKKWFLLIARDAYAAALMEAGFTEKKAEQKAEDDITEDWVLDMLEDYDGVAMYKFETEVERKKQRTAEAILATETDRNRQIDKSLRLWVQQVAQFADNAVTYATIDGYIEAGVKHVRWHSQEDSKVCPECDELDGKVFSMDDIPDRPHFRCRCWLTIEKG